MMFSNLFTFSVFNLIAPMENIFGNGGVMYFFALYSFISGLFVIFYMPETKGKSKEEIAELLSR